ncbi:hypothetical protein [Nannocystis sp.]|uniref:hypothetical protein n=1 Tax=Nannocystis sp. TaxID=1962667 RepID=UPI0025DC45B2|nr:hypothetical protein [Nannocystis sp.]MBK7828931.1 hypothetical protein [Nannocystis sp.]
MLLRTAGIVASVLTAALLSACYEGGGEQVFAREERVVTASDLEGLAPEGLLELDLREEAVRFAFS